MGLVKNEFVDEEEVQAIFNSVNIQEFFEKLENEVKEYYK